MSSGVVEDVLTQDVCPECHGGRLVMDDIRGEVVCESCGLVVLENFVDKSIEWGEGAPDGTVGRTGTPTSIFIHDKGLTTEISPGLRDSYGTPILGEGRTSARRLRMLQKRMKYSRSGEKSLAEALMELDRMASILELPRGFKKEAALVYRRAASQGLVRGRTIRGMAAASLYIACRILRAPRTLSEISQQLGVEGRELRLSFKAITRGLGIGLPPPRAEELLPRVASHLRLPLEFQALALDLIRRVEKVERYRSKTPSGTVAACVYLASIAKGSRISQEAISQATGVSEVTIRLRYTRIAEKLGLDTGRKARRGVPRSNGD